MNEFHEKRLSANHPNIKRLCGMQKILDDLVQKEIDRKLAEKCGMNPYDIALSHFKEASSLIEHGIALLGIENE